jgi:hypothetical protein
MEAQMTDRIEPFTPRMIEDIGAMCRCKRYPGESQNDFLGRAILTLHEANGECTRSLKTADELLAGFLKDARHPVLGPLLQSCWAVVPLIPFMFLIGWPVTLYGLWLGIVCLWPVIEEAGFRLYCRLRPADPEEAKARPA